MTLKAGGDAVGELTTLPSRRWVHHMDIYYCYNSNICEIYDYYTLNLPTISNDYRFSSNYCLLYLDLLL
jgi:hypothetical protein